MSYSSQEVDLPLKAKLLRGFSDLSRLAILETLRQRPCCVNEIVAATGLTQSNVSNHLACLRDCGLVVSETQGRMVCYRLSDPRVGELLGLADELLADVAIGVAACDRIPAALGLVVGAKLHG